MGHCGWMRGLNQMGQQYDSYGNPNYSPDIRINQLMQEGQLRQQMNSQHVQYQQQLGNFYPRQYTTKELKNPPLPIGAKREESKMGFVKEYFNRHRELFMSLAVALILDRYLLGGAFQERLKRIITGILDKTENALQLEKK